MLSVYRITLKKTLTPRVPRGSIRGSVTLHPIRE